MYQTAIFPGRYIQGAGALECLPLWLKELGGSALVIAGQTALRDIVPDLRERCGSNVTLSSEAFGGECTDREIARLSGVVRAKGCAAIVAVGGGKVLDTGKAVAHAAGAKTVIVPTIASTDAPCSALSVIYTADGIFERCDFYPRNPDLVLVDTAIIARAPVRLLIAGIGDALSTWLEADSCRRAYVKNLAGGVGTLAAYSLARLCYDTILEFGVAAVQSCREKVVTPALEHVVEANTLLSGLGFESAGLASAHSIHNGLTALPGTHAFYHGEKVAIGVLAGLFLADRPRALIEEIYAFCESVGLPTVLAEIGLSDPTDVELMEVARKACAETETIHNEPLPVTPERVFASLRAADAYGRARSSRRSVTGA
ncbi:MAG: glycerol dehydrogenase [Chthoniobacterales bacterium]